MDIVMPRLTDSMEEGTILSWLKKDGETVAIGDELVEIETDKASMVYESDAEGTLKILVGEDETRPIGETIATVGDASAEPSGSGDSPGDSAASSSAEEEAPAEQASEKEPAGEEPSGEEAPAAEDPG
ncbi:MAG: lipoyl domain-containing protein, partial [Actinomycetota bacterium]|nr:lipoyl domain-containing protein [Actinomycetota bacterium]